MEKSKIEIAKKMKIESLKSLILSSAIRPVALILIFLFIVQFFILYQLNGQRAVLREQQLKTLVQEVKSKQAEKLALIASSPVFIDFLRSGPESRDLLKLDIEMLFAGLSDRSIQGVEILDRELNVLFKNGSGSASNFTLNLCYLDSNLDPVYGNCLSFLKIYLNKEEYIQKFKSLNPRIEICLDCQVDFQDQEGFGLFKIYKSQGMSFNFGLEEESFNYVYLLELAFMIGVFVLSAWLYFIFISISDKYLFSPLRYIMSSLSQGGKIDCQKINVSELVQLATEINSFQERTKRAEELEKKESLFKLAKQVAHDIRSPLTALQSLSFTSQVLEHEKRVLIDSSLSRISEIANNLLDQGAECPIRPVSVLEILRGIINEKNLKFSNIGKFVRFEGVLRNNLFVEINACEFRRAVSNLIDNAIDASSSAVVDVNIEKVDQKCLISFKNDGSGIDSEILKFIGTKELTTKKDGNGLGLMQVNNFVSASGGKLIYQSPLEGGTLTTIELPLIDQPSWHLENLNLTGFERVIVVDDDHSIFSFWRSKIKDNVQVIYYSNPKDFIKNQSSLKRGDLVLIDFEFRNSSLTGLDVILEVKPSPYEVLLITSKAGDSFIRRECERNGIKLISKEALPFLDPVFNDNNLRVLIDDDPIIHISWKMFFESLNLPLRTYFSVDEFLNDSSGAPLNSQIFIDSDLGKHQKGEVLSEKIFNDGFKSLYLCTGFSKEDINKPEWIKDIVKKSPSSCFEVFD